MRPRYVMMLVGAAAVVSLGAFGIGAQGENAPAPFRLAAVSRGPVVATVSASGNFRPLASVAVTASIPGQLVEVLVEDNAAVKAGDVLAKLDDTGVKARVASVEADLAVAQGAVEVARGQIERARSGVANAEAVRAGAAADVDHAGEGLSAAERDLKRTQKLAGTGDAARVDIERAQAGLDQAQAGVTAAKARAAAAAAGITAAQGDVRVAEAQLTNAQAGVGARQAALSEARLELERTLIKAPFDGMVLERNATPGQLVGNGGQPLFTIASDLHSLRLHASVDESDIGRLAAGQPVTFGVDAYPNQGFQGKVEVIKKAPQTVQNVVTYDVVVAADNPDLRLLPGMTANAKIVVAEEDDALRVPSAALRFSPSGRGGRSASGDTVWILDDQQRPKAVQVRPGQSDGAYTAIASDALKPGDQVIVGRAPPKEQGRNAFSF
jgi:HlyD family secretion protein